MLLFSLVGKRTKKPLPKFSIVAETTPPVTPPRDLDKRTNITIGDRVFEVEADDLETLGLLGQGAYGIVERMKHKITGTIMAVKVLKFLMFYIFVLQFELCFSENTCNCKYSGAKEALDRS
jgi:hypothetical protein